MCTIDIPVTTISLCSKASDKIESFHMDFKTPFLLNTYWAKLRTHTHADYCSCFDPIDKPWENRRLLHGVRKTIGGFEPTHAIALKIPNTTNSFRLSCSTQTQPLTTDSSAIIFSSSRTIRRNVAQIVMNY